MNIYALTICQIIFSLITWYATLPLCILEELVPVKMQRALMDEDAGRVIMATKDTGAARRLPSWDTIRLKMFLLRKKVQMWSRIFMGNNSFECPWLVGLSHQRGAVKWMLSLQPGVLA